MKKLLIFTALFTSVVVSRQAISADIAGKGTDYEFVSTVNGALISENQLYQALVQ
jgi:hypothetical protein